MGDCPNGAITVEEQEAAGFDEEAVKRHLATLNEAGAAASAPDVCAAGPGPGGGCPGSRVSQFTEATDQTSGATASPPRLRSQLRQWPVQLHLVPPTAPYYMGADVLLAADCTAFSLPDFHGNHLQNKALAVACPKLDQGMDIYLAKLVAMIDLAKVNTLSVLIMEVPCCEGLVRLVQEATSRAERRVPVKKVVVGIRGNVLSEDWV